MNTLSQIHFGSLSGPDRFRLIQCAKLSKFAYDLSDPGQPISVDEQRAREYFQKEVLKDIEPVQVIGPLGFDSNAWFSSILNRWKSFRSYGYIGHFTHGVSTGNNSLQYLPLKHKVVVVFRGTWNNLGKTTAVLPDPSSNCLSRGISWILIKLYTKVQQLPRLKNIGWSDLYYNAFVIRLPFTEGELHMGYSYWGAVMLERYFSPTRKVASSWISKSGNQPLDERKDGDVHLGFWSLWAAGEGFSKSKVLRQVEDIIKNIKEDEETEVWIVGHSLGGAVSSFAALDIMKLKNSVENKNRNITFHHVTLGAPPIGTSKFANYFNTRIDKLGGKSWAVTHDRDLIPACFAWCASTEPLKRLAWWNDWATVGKKVSIHRPDAEAEKSKSRLQSALGAGNTLLWRTAFIIPFSVFLVSLGVGNVACGFISTLSYFCSGKSLANTKDPLGTFKDRLPHVQILKSGVDLKHHSLETYIKLMEVIDQEENVMGCVR